MFTSLYRLFAGFCLFACFTTLHAQEEAFQHYDGRLELNFHLGVGQATPNYDGTLIDEMTNASGNVVNLGVDLEIYLVQNTLSLYTALNFSASNSMFNASTTSSEFNGDIRDGGFTGFELSSSEMEYTTSMIDVWVPVGLVGRYDVSEDVTLKAYLGAHLSVPFVGGVEVEHQYEGFVDQREVEGVKELSRDMIDRDFLHSLSYHLGIGMTYKSVSLSLDLRDLSGMQPLVLFNEDVETANLRMLTFKFGYVLFR